MSSADDSAALLLGVTLELLYEENTIVSLVLLKVRHSEQGNTCNNRTMHATDYPHRHRPATGVAVAGPFGASATGRLAKIATWSKQTYRVTRRLADALN